MSDQKIALANRPSQVGDGEVGHRAQVQVVAVAVDGFLGHGRIAIQLLEKADLHRALVKHVGVRHRSSDFQLLADGPSRQVVEEGLVELTLFMRRPLGRDADVFDDSRSAWPGGWMLSMARTDAKY